MRALYVDESSDIRKTKPQTKIEGIFWLQEKIAELKHKRYEIGLKFDEATAKLNHKLRDGTNKIFKLFREIDQDENNRKRTLLISLRNIQSMVIEGYELFNNKQEYDNKLKEMKKDYLELILDGMPISWIPQFSEVVYFDQFLESSGVKYSNDVTEK